MEGVADMSVTTHEAGEAISGGQPTSAASPGSGSGTAYTVRFERRRERAFIPALFYLYLAVIVPFAAWRCTITNWHVWTGPPALAADLFSAMMFILFLGYTQHIYLPVHRRADLSSQIVDCLIPTHTEPVSVIEPTILAALRIRGIRNVLVLANLERADVRAMTQRLGVRYFPRNSNEHGKAGNLNHGLAYTDADLILTLDADHIARPEFLERTLGYFDDPTVALVQTPQSFYNTESLLYRRSGGQDSKWSESNMFYQTVQPAKNRWNAAFYCGTSAVLRRAALDEVGGFATGTVTEDIHTSLRIHAKGWRSVFVPEPLAFGLEAQNLKEFYAQRRRWAAGSVTLMLRNADSPLWVRGLTIHQRLGYLTATLAHIGGLQRLIHFLLPAVTLATMVAPVTIPVGYYGLSFIGYFVLSFGLSAIYSRGTYHPLHSDAYSLANIAAQVSSLGGLVRTERRFTSARKNASSAERTWVKPVLWALGLADLAAVAYGIELLATGNHSWLVVMSTTWAAINGIWMWWVLVYVERYEHRKFVADHEGLEGLAMYQYIVDRFGGSIPAPAPVPAPALVPAEHSPAQPPAIHALP
jgi:cellulose synthase (UDP-forming)